MRARLASLLQSHVLELVWYGGKEGWDCIVRIWHLRERGYGYLRHLLCFLKVFDLFRLIRESNGLSVK